jgi:hypothetical protein
VTTAPQPRPGWTPDRAAPAGVDDASVGRGWDLADLSRIVASLREAGYSEFRLEVADGAADFTLGVRFGPDGERVDPGAAAAERDSAPSSDIP